MKIYYQGNPGSYMHIASLEIEKDLDMKINSIEGKPDFSDVWESIDDNSIGVLAIENSYMGSIHPNIYGFLKYDYKIICEYSLEINHCLCSKEKDIKDIKQAYSQNPALEQCHNYLKSKNIEPKSFSDTSLSAKHVKQSEEKGIGAICSEKAAQLNGLNILDRKVQDQDNNTTRFIVVTKQDTKINYLKKSNKISVLFEAKDVPSSLHKCLLPFAINDVNLTKIESLPSFKGPFNYHFWIDFEGSLNDKNISKSLEELKLFTSFIKIIGEY